MSDHVTIRSYSAADRKAVLTLAIAAWQPVFDAMKGSVLPYVYEAFYPHGWEQRQRADIAAFLDAAHDATWIAECRGTAAGFVGITLHPEDRMGEITVIAVDPAFQRMGIADRLMTWAEERIREAGMVMVMVETGGDPGHAAARAAYEAHGFQRWPVARYFKPL
ncbi:GNAT family N-acetyltransferase [Thalassococcus sp. S3]|uniref:GNAT family N-acetyltransferase n=1 Tax=Thalassococcus sp. S3 TaxID=2017482 RepID=UPI0010240A21|nr:GNAT family N-acetyltransferase [Thalassococcus sp. S3]QBF30418.1 GNAT family N-acetyltransferase [Thalassococcus sp. S3]